MRDAKRHKIWGNNKNELLEGFRFYRFPIIYMVSARPTRFRGGALKIFPKELPSLTAATFRAFAAAILCRFARCGINRA